MRVVNYPTPFSIRLPPPELESLDKVREPLAISRSVLVRQAIREFLERQLTTQTKSAEQGTSSQGA